MNDQFAKDQAYWRDWWSLRRHHKTESNRKGYLVLSFIWMCIAILLINLISQRFKTLELDGVSSYEDARNYFLILATLLSPVIAFIGFHLADQRLHEQEKQTRTMINAALQQRYVDAVRLLAETKSYQKTAGITALRDIEIAKNETLMTSAAATLIAFIRQRGRATPSEVQDIEKRNRRLREFREALQTLLFLENASGNPIKHRKASLVFHDLDLARSSFPLTARHLSVASFSGLPEMHHMHFAYCDLSTCDFSATNMNNIIFERCNLSGTRFLGCHYSGGLHLCDISGATLPDASMGDLTTCIYHPHHPPIPSNFEALPTPYLSDSETSKATGRYMTVEEAEDFWSSDDNDQYRPRDRNGNLIEIIDPYKDDSA